MLVAPSASATPTGCSSGSRPSPVAGEYYGWALCSGGTGTYDVTLTCYSTGATYYVYGRYPQAAGSGVESRDGCPAGAEPLSVGYTLSG